MKKNALVGLLSFWILVVAAGLDRGVSAVDDQVGYFRTKVWPQVAGLFINGNYFGTVAMYSHREAAIKLKPGTYEVEILDPRYKTLKAAVKIEEGKWTTLRRRLQPLQIDTEGPFGDLKTDGFPNAAIYLNGKYYANTKELQNPLHTLLLRSGEYDMKIMSVSGEPIREEKITINADETVVVYAKGAVVRRR